MTGRKLQYNNRTVYYHDAQNSTIPAPLHSFKRNAVNTDAMTFIKNIYNNFFNDMIIFSPW